MAKITIRDVARAAQVSVGTASMALNGKKKVNEQTRKKILDVAHQLNYNPNPYAQFLTSDKTNMVGLIVTDPSNPFFGSLIDLLERDLSKHGYNMMLGISRGDLAGEKSIIERFISMKVSGIIAVPSHGRITNTDHYLKLQEYNIPLCFITSYYPGIEAPCVMSDLSDGSYQLTRHLLESGHRRIVYLTGDLSSPVSSLRVNGYMSAYRDLGISYCPEWNICTDVTLTGGYDAASRAVELQPDAIITINDFMALGVLKYLKEKQIRVPEEISVAGYDDLVYSAMLETSLTTVHQPLTQICKRTVDVFLQQCSGQEILSEKILLKPTLVLRASSGAKNG